MRSLEATWALKGSLWNIPIVSGDGAHLRLDLFTERLEGPPRADRSMSAARRSKKSARMASPVRRAGFSPRAFVQAAPSTHLVMTSFTPVGRIGGRSRRCWDAGVIP